MRRAAFAFALLAALAGCAPTAPVHYYDSGETLAMRARADSLLALPPDSLTTADVAWLQGYAMRRDEARVRAAQRTAEIAEERARQTQLYLSLGGALSVLGVLIYLSL